MAAWCIFPISANAAAFEPLDGVHLPERPLAVEGQAAHLSGEVGQLLQTPGRRQAGSSKVVVEVEVGILDPHRMVQLERHLDEPAAEGGGEGQTARHGVPYRLERQAALARLEHVDARHMHV